MSRLFAALFALAALVVPPAQAQDPAPRGRTNEYSLNVQVIGSHDYDFDGGATARNDGGAGVALSIARNLNDHFAIGAEVAWSVFNFRAGVAPAAGNAAARFETDGDTENIALRVHATWYLLSRPVTPFLTAGVGVIFFDPEFDDSAPADACWSYPWYGQICGAAPENTLTRLTYSAGAGLRWDLPPTWGYNGGFLRFLVGGEWIHFDEASSPVGYWQVRADFGARF
jgi:Outer membrane protein beta-barrel domain